MKKNTISKITLSTAILWVIYWTTTFAFWPSWGFNWNNEQASMTHPNSVEQTSMSQTQSFKEKTRPWFWTMKAIKKDRVEMRHDMREEFKKDKTEFKHNLKRHDMREEFKKDKTEFKHNLKRHDMREEFKKDKTEFKHNLKEKYNLWNQNIKQIKEQLKHQRKEILEKIKSVKDTLLKIKNELSTVTNVTKKNILENTKQELFNKYNELVWQYNSLSKKIWEAEQKNIEMIKAKAKQYWIETNENTFKEVQDLKTKLIATLQKLKEAEINRNFKAVKEIKTQLEELKQKLKTVYPQLKNYKTQINNKIKEQKKEAVNTFKKENKKIIENKYMKQLKQKISTKIKDILNKKLFSRISKLPVEKQKIILNKILNKVWQKKVEFQKAFEENSSKRNQIKLFVINQLELEVMKYKNNLYNENQDNTNNIIDWIISQ